MTPLAQRLMRQELEGKRGLNFGGLTASDLVDARCFDCTAVSGMAHELAADMHKRNVVTKQVAFLPAPFTWVEVQLGPEESLSGRTSGRVAFGLRAEADEPSAAIFVATTTEVEGRSDLAGKVHLLDIGRLWLGESAVASGLRAPVALADYPGQTAPEQRHTCLIYALLAIINTPRLIGQCRHAPHVGLQRQLRRSDDLASAQLPEWTEVRLNVLDTKERRDTGDTTGILTGQRALHFVRSFIRIRLGRLELVRAHQRGNPEMGERRPVYVVAP
jgi:hypothetical protein